jgi:hypothetical protein
MGSQFNSFDFPPVDSDELKNLWATKANALRDEFGYDYYSGYNYANGLTVCGERFGSENAAMEYIAERTSKHGPVMAVRMGDFERAFQQSRAGQSLRKRWIALEADYAHVDQQIIQRLQAAKSKTRGCKRCGSQIAVAYLSAGQHGGIDCPVCHATDFVLTEGDRKRRESLRVRRDRAR